MSSSWIDSLDHYVVSFLISCNLLYLKVCFVRYEDWYASFLLVPIACNIFFHPRTFSLYVSWGLKWVSCRQYIYGSCFCIHSPSLCLLVVAFNPFPFKVIIDIYLPIAIFLVVCSWFCRSFSFSCTSCTLTFVVKLVWWYWILLTFAFLKSFWFFHQFWMRSLLGTVILVVEFSLSVL